jgi:beta-glucosidase
MKAAKELKAFRKVLVPKGATIAVTLEINASDLAWFNETDGKWVVSPGKYAIHAGSSSRDIRASAAITIN